MPPTASVETHDSPKFLKRTIRYSIRTPGKTESLRLQKQPSTVPLSLLSKARKRYIKTFCVAALQSLAPVKAIRLFVCLQNNRLLFSTQPELSWTWFRG